MDNENNEVNTTEKYRIIAWQEVIIWGLTLLPFILYFIWQDQLPDQVPMHYGPSGEPNRYGSPFELSLIMLVVGLFTNGILMIAPLIDPKKGNYRFFTDFYFLLRLITAMLLSGIVLLTFYQALGNAVDLMFYTNLMILFLLLVAGNFLGKVRQTWFVGIRTPWTLNSEEVWRKTHRLAGRLLFGSALLGMIALFFIPNSWSLGLILLISGIGLIVPAVLSYFWSRNQ